MCGPLGPLKTKKMVVMTGKNCIQVLTLIFKETKGQIHKDIMNKLSLSSVVVMKKYIKLAQRDSHIVITGPNGHQKIVKL